MPLRYSQYPSDGWRRSYRRVLGPLVRLAHSAILLMAFCQPASASFMALLIPAGADPTMPTAPIRIIGVWVMVHVAAVAGITAPAPSPGGAGIGGKSDEHQRKPACRHEQCRKPFHRTPHSFAGHLGRACETRKPGALSAPDLLLTVVRMMRRCHGCLDTVKRVNTAWRGNTVAMMHYLRIVNSRGN